MNEKGERMEKLKMRVEEAEERFKEDGNFDLEGYVDEIVIPALGNVLQDLCLEIEERHKIDEPERWQENFVIHYTSIGTLVSMLQKKIKNKQNVAKDKQNEAKDEQDVAKDKQNASLRLCDSVHFNDPDEGDYFFHKLNLPKKHAWLGKKKNPTPILPLSLFPMMIEMIEI